MDDREYTEDEFDEMSQESLFELWMDSWATFLLTSNKDNYETLHQQMVRHREAYDKRFPMKPVEGLT